MNKFDPTKPYRRRDGLPAKIIYELPRQWVVVSENMDKEEWVFFVNKPDGNCLPGDNESRYDLVNIPEKHEVTVCFYRNVNKLIYVSSYRCGGELIAKKVITFEEGEGLEEAK